MLNGEGQRIKHITNGDSPYYPFVQQRTKQTKPIYRIGMKNAKQTQKYTNPLTTANGTPK